MASFTVKMELNTGGCNDALSIDSSQRAIRRIMKEVERCGGASFFYLIRSNDHRGETLSERYADKFRYVRYVDCQFRSSVVAVEVTILVHIGFEIENLTRNYFLPSTMVTFSSFFLYFSFLICIFRMNIYRVLIYSWNIFERSILQKFLKRKYWLRLIY